ncbi:MAG: DUF1648 domain-containing protein [Chloroflexota bacterium]
MSNKGPIKQSTTASIAFRWTYILFPLIILFLTLAVTVYFYRLLPADVAYHFKTDGSPDKWLGRGAIVLIAILPQLFFTLLAWIVTWGITRLLARYKEFKSTGIKAESILLIMGNMVALPQLILFFAMLDIFSYNSYQIHLFPLRVLILIVLALGSVILVIFFIRTMSKILRTSIKEQ